jgi:hypothetical protein
VKRLLIAMALIAGLCSPATSAAPALADQPPPPGVGIRLVDAPVATEDDPRARAYIVDHMKPGTVIERRIEVSNGTDSSKPIEIYPAAANIVEGTFAGAEGRTENELSRWITVDPAHPDLNSGERRMANVTIDVPQDATRGEHYGVVWAQMVAPAEGAGITQVSRVGIRLYLSVGPGGAPPSDFAITELTAARDANGNPLVRAAVHNTGERALDLGGELLLDEGPGGVTAGPFTAKSGNSLGIGDTGVVDVVLDDQLSNGPWRAHITVKSGLTERSAEATITFPEPGQVAPAVPAEESALPLWALITIAALLLAVLALVIVLLTRLRKAKLA